MRWDDLGKIFGKRPVMAISLWQPWATLAITPEKPFETRSWATDYRGPLVICAGKGGLSTNDMLHLLLEEEFRQALAPILGLSLEMGRYEFADAANGLLPRGKALGCVDLVDCVSTDQLLKLPHIPGRVFGDFSPGRFAWKLENKRQFDQPVPVKGKQGFFRIDILPS